MQGKKEYQEKLFSHFQLSERVPRNNFYRKLNEVLDLGFLYAKTKPFYGSSGQKSLDPIVFFKLCLVGYFENIVSDRSLINHSSMRLDILFFIGYDIDQELPWHSTISRTRQLFPETIFEEVFTHVFTMCVEKGMVLGHTQAIDSAPIKANASMDTLELKVPQEDLEMHLQKVRVMNSADRIKPRRKSKGNKADQEQQTIQAKPEELQAIKSRNKKWSKDQDQRPGSSNKGSKYTSNKTHYSPTDPDARISVKPGKARKLNFMSQLSVDIGHHVISDIWAYHADKKDNQYLSHITHRLKQRLWNNGLLWKNCLADTGYSSGENYAFLESQNITSYIPPHGTYKGGPDGFKHIAEHDHYICPQGKIIPFKKVYFETKNQTKKKEYRSSTALCKGCPIMQKCLGKSKEKKFSITYYKEEYDRNIERIKSKRGREMKSKRSSTVEPVFGTLTQFRGLRKINTIGIKQANKVMHLSAIAYNLKKYMKFITKKAKENVKRTELIIFWFKTTHITSIKPI